MLIMTIYGILCGYADFTNLTDFLKVHEGYFTNLLNLGSRTPSHNTLSKEKNTTIFLAENLILTHI